MGVHKSITHFVEWEKLELGLDDTIISAQLTSISFDAIMRDLFLPLICGGRLCIPNHSQQADLIKLLNWMQDEGVTLIHTVPSIILSWLSIESFMTVELRQLQFMCLSGEPLFDKLINKWKHHFPYCDVRFINFYGPSETTMIKCFHYVSSNVQSGLQYCGKPISYTDVLVFSKENELAAPMQIGEVFIRTPFMTLGYINSAQENNQAC